MIRYTHICSGAARWEDTKSPPSSSDPRMHFPAGWESHMYQEDCPDCGDDAPLRGAYAVVTL